MGLLQQSTARNIVFLMVASSDHLAALTGATVTVTLSKNGGAFGTAGGSVTEISSGWYSIALTTTDTNTLGDLALHCTATSGDPTDMKEQVVAFSVTDSVRMGLTALPNAAAEAAGGLYTRGSGAGQINQTNNGQVDANAARTGGTTNTGRDIGASVLLSSGVGAGQVSLSSGTVTVGTNNDKTGYGLSAAAVQAIWDALTSALTTVGSIGKRIADFLTGDAYTRLGAPAGASVSADVAAVKTDTSTLTGRLTSTRAGLLDNLDATVSSRLASASYTAPDNTTISNIYAAVDTEVAAIKTVTDHLATSIELNAGNYRFTTAALANAPTGGGGGGSLTAADVWAYGTRTLTSSSGGTVGSGSTAYPVTVTRPDGTTPIEGVACWVTTDSAGTHAVAGTEYTDALGRINGSIGFMLDHGNYYLWRQHGSWQFSNPFAFTVS